MLIKARRPVIYAGQGVLYAEATPELAELLNAPVMTTTLGKTGFRRSILCPWVREATLEPKLLACSCTRLM